MMPFTIEEHDDRYSWLMGRKRGCGASDIASILGMNRWRAAFTVATDKLTNAVEDGWPSEEAEWGHRDEPAIAEKFSEVTGREVIDPGDFTIYRSKERPHVFCTPDRILPPDSCLEIKETFGENGKEWLEDVPREYKIQLQITMYVLGLDHAFFAARINWFGVTFRFHPMRRNDKFLSWALPRVDKFWESLQKGEMPDCDESDATARALALRYPSGNQKHVDLDLEDLGKRYDELTSTESKAKREKEAIKNRVKAELGENSLGVLPDMSGFGWSGSNGKRRFRRIEKVNVE